MIRRAVVAVVLSLGLVQAGAAQGVAQWNVYVYMNAQPNLDEYALADLEELRQAGASPDVNVYVQLALSDQQVRRYQIQPGEARLVDELGAINPSDSSNLADFVAWGAAQGPARRHCVVVWGHGTAVRAGAGDTQGPADAQGREAGMDLHHLREAAVRIRQALGRRVDVWGYDSCFMQRLEVGYELRPAARYLVASQDAVDGEGWDYQAWLSLLLDRPATEGAELARAITRLSSESASGEPRTIACVDLARYREVAGAVSALGGELARYGADRGHRASVVTAHYRARRYAGDDTRSSAYLDLEDLAGAFTAGDLPPALSAAARSVRSAVEAAVLLRFGDARSSGISIYHQVQSELPPGYRDLAFARDTRWDEYLAGQPLQPDARAGGTVYRRTVREPIPDGNPAGLTSTIRVQDVGVVRSVRVFLNIQHDYVGDLAVTLVAPGGRHAVVLGRVGGNGRRIRGWVGGESLTRELRGEPAAGDWQLRVQDLGAQDSGVLVAWRLEVAADPPAPPEGAPRTAALR